MVERIRLGELLVKAGVLDDFQLRLARMEQHRTGASLGRILLKFGYLAEELLLEIASQQLRIPLAKLEAVELPTMVLERIRVEDAFARSYCPERFERGILTVAVSDPTDTQVVDDIAAQTGLRVRQTIASEAEVRSALRRLFDTYKAPAPGFSAGSDAPMGVEVDPHTHGLPSLKRDCTPRSMTPIPPPIPAARESSDLYGNSLGEAVQLGSVSEAKTKLMGSSGPGGARPRSSLDERFGPLPPPVSNDDKARPLTSLNERFGPLPSVSNDNKARPLTSLDERFGPLSSVSETGVSPVPRPSPDERFGPITGPSTSLDERAGLLPSFSDEPPAYVVSSVDKGKPSARVETRRSENTQGRFSSALDDHMGLLTNPPMVTHSGGANSVSHLPELIEVPGYSAEHLMMPKASSESQTSELLSELDVMTTKLQAAQKRQNRAIRIMIDMLVESGVFTEEEFRARLGLHRSRSRNRR